MSIKWYVDDAARMLRAKLEERLHGMLPGHKLSHVGVNRDFVTQEVEMRLHFVPEDVHEKVQQQRITQR